MYNIVIGDCGVGKTASIIRFTQNYFLVDFDPSFEDSYRHQTIIDDEVVIVELFEMAGSEEFTLMHDMKMRECEGVLFMYSITNKNSFDRISEYYLRVVDRKGNNNFPFIIVGNKCDVVTSRQVDEGEINELAAELNSEWIETSAKTNQYSGIYFST